MIVLLLRNAERSIKMQKILNTWMFFFFFLRNQTKGFRVLSNAMRKWLVTFFYFLLHVILTCFLYVPHRRIPLQSSNSLSLSLRVPQLREENPIGFELTVSKIHSGWVIFFYFTFCSQAGECVTFCWAAILGQIVWYLGHCIINIH